MCESHAHQRSQLSKDFKGSQLHKMELIAFFFFFFFFLVYTTSRVSSRNFILGGRLTDHDGEGRVWDESVH